MSSLTGLIVTFGYLGIFITVFAESGFLLGFFLPGDSLLFTVGLLASQGLFNIWVLLVVVVVAGILGNSFGYYIGRKAGPKIFARENSLLFKKSYVKKTEGFFEQYGKRSIILARFVPVVRTFAPVFAGVGNMDYWTFITYNTIGGILWGGGVLLISYFLARSIPGIERYTTVIIIGIIIVSLIPVAIQLFKKDKKN